MMKAFIYFSLALLLVSCRGNNDIEDRGSYEVNTSQHAYAAFPRVRILVIHYTAGDFDTSLSTLVGNNVSAHYLIAQEQPKPVINRWCGNWFLKVILRGMPGSVTGAVLPG